MSKFSRNDLKDLVKECLVEILQEGINESISRPQSFRRVAESRERVAETREVIPPSRTIRDKINFLPKHENAPQRAAATSNHNIAGITDDPVMRDILSDTASTTLREQIQAEGRNPQVTNSRDPAVRIVAESDPMDLFSGAADKWASLAFSGPVNRQ